MTEDSFILKLQETPKALNCLNLAPKDSWPGFGPKGAHSQAFQKQVSIASWQAPRWPNQACGQDLAQKGPIPKVSRSKFQWLAGKPQSCQIWLQKVPGQDLAQKGPIPKLSRSKFQKPAGKPQGGQIWLQKLPPGRNLRGFFQIDCFFVTISSPSEKNH